VRVQIVFHAENITSSNACVAGPSRRANNNFPSRSPRLRFRSKRGITTQDILLFIIILYSWRQRRPTYFLFLIMYILSPAATRFRSPRTRYHIIHARSTTHLIYLPYTTTSARLTHVRVIGKSSNTSFDNTNVRSRIIIIIIIISL